MELAHEANTLLAWSPDTKYSAPRSWTLMFGPPAPAAMFW